MTAKKWGSLVAPLVVTVLLCMYFAFWGFALIFTPSNILFKVLACGIPACLIVVSLYNLIHRYNELKGGIEDDLDNY